MIKNEQVYGFLACWFCATALVFVASAQNRVTDDSAVFQGYLALHLAIDQAAEQDPSLRHSTALMIGISDADFQIVTSIARSLSMELRNIASEETANAQSSDSTASLANRARAFNARRQAASLSAVKIIESRPSANSWFALRAYISGRYRGSIQARPVSGTAVRVK